MRRTLSILVALLISAAVASAKDYKISSPNDKASVVIKVDRNDGITADVFYLDKLITSLGPIGLEVEGAGILGESPRVRKSNIKENSDIIYPVVKEKRAAISNEYNEIEMIFRESSYRLIFRVYDDGVAYRFKTDIEGKIRVIDELAGFNFPDDAIVFYPTDVSMFTHSERLYEHVKLSELGDKLASTPFLVSRDDGISVLVTEVDLQDYPGLYVKGDPRLSFGLQVEFPNFVLEEELVRDRDVKPVKRADYLAETDGNRFFPWRLVAFEEEEMNILDNDIVYRLSPECRLDDTSWIKPGLVSWDWWNATNNFGVPFKSGVNTATYKYHIDFAADYGLDYIILDEGWSVPADLFKINPDVDVEKICEYAEKKGVGVILWVLWNALEKDLIKALDQFAAWNVKGIKVDFMQRDDQYMVNYYWRVSKEAAKRHMLVDFHGAYKPAGLRRAYPNMITREGLKGLENCKWSADITPDHDCTLPFIRQFAGPMDYTPGAMRNAEKRNFHPAFTRPMSMGTRAHQLALYVIFESPLQMLADCPSNYYKEPLSMEFLKDVPTVWDETIPLFGKVGDFAGVARKSGDEWYIGAITDWDQREFEVDTGFLPEGDYEITQYADGPNAATFAEDLAKKSIRIKSGEKIKIEMAPGGGFVAVIRQF